MAETCRSVQLVIVSCAYVGVLNIQGDQKVFVHLMIKTQLLGAQRLFDYPVSRVNSDSKLYQTVIMTSVYTLSIHRTKLTCLEYTHNR
jgi:hypothetical protein